MSEALIQLIVWYVLSLILVAIFFWITYINSAKHAYVLIASGGHNHLLAHRRDKVTVPFGDRLHAGRCHIVACFKGERYQAMADLKRFCASNF